MFGAIGRNPEVRVCVSNSAEPDSISYRQSPGFLRFGQAMYEVDADRVPRRVVVDVYRTHGAKGTLVAEYRTVQGLVPEDNHSHLS